jgi:hypothetical protein
VSQLIGQNFKTRIPTFSDDASIEEALKVYHYGVDNYTVETIPDDSIEGNFRNLNTRLSSVESIVTGLDPNTPLVKFVSLASAPNIITGQNTTTVPLTIRAIASQTVNLQRWENSSNNLIASISTSGYLATAGYASIGSITPVTTTAFNINVINPSNRGIVLRAAASQTANLQEWQNSSGSVMSRVSADGTIYSRGTELGDSQNPFLLMGS